MKKKISVITVSYNSIKTIQDTLESVLKQSFTNYEHIIIDGNSSDGSLDIIKHYNSISKGKLRYISEPDSGIYDAMNKGVKMATGDIIGFLNSDDIYANNDVLSTIHNKFLEKDIFCIYGNLKIVSSQNLNKVVRYYKVKHFKSWWLNFGIMPPHPTLYIKKSIFNEVGFFDSNYKIVADFEFIIRLFKKYKIKHSHINQYLVHMRDGGVSNEGIQSKIQITNEIKNACSINNVYTNVFFLYFRFLFKITQTFIS